jgi:hypothetical protein
VLVVASDHGELLVQELAEKPGPAVATELERRYGTRRLRFLEGPHARLTAEFVRFARGYHPPADAEPKLALALAAYARSHPVTVVTIAGQVVDLGTIPPCGCKTGRSATGNRPSTSRP